MPIDDTDLQSQRLPSLVAHGRQPQLLLQLLPGFRKPPLRHQQVGKFMTTTAFSAVLSNDCQLCMEALDIGGWTWQVCVGRCEQGYDC